MLFTTLNLTTIAAMSLLATPTPAALAYSISVNTPSITTAASSVDDAAEALAAVNSIIADFEAKLKDARLQLSIATSDKQRRDIAANQYPKPGDSFDELRAICEEHPSSEAAATAATWAYFTAPTYPVVGVGGTVMRGLSTLPGTDWALQLLAENFADDEQRIERVAMLNGLTSREADALETLRSNTTNRRIKALADFNRGTQLLQMALAAKELAQRGSTGDPHMQFYMAPMDLALKDLLRGEHMADQCQQQGEQLLEYCAANYRNVETQPGSGASVAAAAEDALYETRHLQVGHIAPDIEGVDAEGLRFKLSDYRGQIVVLDFWAFWCGPCVEMIPHEKELIERLDGEPFVIIGVNSDGPQAYDRGIEQYGVPWRSFMAGSPSGEIPTAWKVKGWPTVYVIDANGVIRFKGVRAQTLDRAVDTLLAEMHAGK